jgi:hypothetical protein
MQMRNHPHLYEISAWPWLDRLSRDSESWITLANVPSEAWDAVASGMDYVYLMGVWKRSRAGRLMARTDATLLEQYDRVLPGWAMGDVPGSPYSVAAYEPDDRMGGWSGLESARRELADRGVRLVLDFVPNHTGFDHAWLQHDPDFYVQGTLDDYRAHPDHFRPVEDAADSDRVRFIACGRDPFFPPWRDVAQLNYFNPATRDAAIAELAAIAQHCDGVRCDMAMLVVNDVFKQTWGDRIELLWPPPDDEFWPAATSRVPIAYVAEVYWNREYQLQQQGFHYTYDKRLLDRLHEADPAGARGQLQADPAYAARLARFLENHDEARSPSAFGDRLRAAAALTFTLPGMRFFFDGQFAGADVRAPVQLGRWPSWPDRPAIRDLYGRLLAAIDTPLFHDGEWTLLDVRAAGDASSGDVLAWAWRRGAEIAVVAGNITDHDAQGLVAIGDLPVGNMFAVRDRLADRSWEWSRHDLADGLFVRLRAGDAHLLSIESI